ncbi:cupin domain-containing protein [Erwinia sp. 9145]|uniref:cupin domain-containing protein n=1 Tax=Erwinia sp. 9145 TaxID=1500895 RepID=UPI0005532576|nr:cupin domain-containing protein [Erwinia sp. 9145]
MLLPSGSLLAMMSFAAGTFSAGASGNPQFMTLQRTAGVPNNPLPLIIYPQVVPDDVEDIASWFEDLFARHLWLPRWRYPVYPYTHYHPNTHELLGISAGSAQILFGGETGRAVTVHTGDAVLIPAGVGHQQLAASDDFFAVGAYPRGMQPETCRDEPSLMTQSLEAIDRVPMPQHDPITGGEGAVTEIWHPLVHR